MKSYSEKLVRLLKKEMATPQQDRGGYNNPTINASGDGSRSIKLVDYKNGTIEIVGNDYLLKVDKGTKRAKVEDIAEWIVAKPVNYETRRLSVTLKNVNDPATLKLAQRIKNKINRVGSRPTRFIERTVQSHLKNLKVVAPVVEDVRENVVDILKEAGFDVDGKKIIFV